MAVPPTTSLDIRLVKRREAGRLTIMGNLDDYRTCMDEYPHYQRQEHGTFFRSQPLLLSVWSDVLLCFGQSFGQAALYQVVRPNPAAWKWANLMDGTAMPEGWSESLYDQCFNSVLGDCRHSGTWTNGVIRTSLVLPNGKSSLVRMPQPPEELKSKALDVIWGDNPPTDAPKFAWKERSDLTPVGDGEWIDYEGHEGHWSDSISEFHDCCRLLVGLGKKPADFSNTPIGFMPLWYVAEKVQGEGIPLGATGKLFNVKLLRKEPLSRAFGTSLIPLRVIIEKGKEGLLYKDRNGSEEHLVPATPKSKALELVDALKAYLAKVKAGKAGEEIEGNRKTGRAAGWADGGKEDEAAPCLFGDGTRKQSKYGLSRE